MAVFLQESFLKDTRKCHKKPSVSRFVSATEVACCQRGAGRYGYSSDVARAVGEFIANCFEGFWLPNAPNTALAPQNTCFNAFRPAETFFAGSRLARPERLESFRKRSICATSPLRMSVQPQQMTMKGEPGPRFSRVTAEFSLGEWLVSACHLPEHSLPPGFHLLTRSLFSLPQTGHDSVFGNLALGKRRQPVGQPDQSHSCVER